jgi:predicted DNA-binding ribbon-helix-helix protein
MSSDRWTTEGTDVEKELWAIGLQPEYVNMLREISAWETVTVATLVSVADSLRDQNPLDSALRVFILNYYRSL